MKARGTWIRFAVWLVMSLILGGLLAGCDGSGRYVGTWEVDKAEVIEVMNRGAAEETREEFGPFGEMLAREMSEQLVSSMQMTLEIRRDRTWTMAGSIFGNEYDRSGEWRMDGGELVLIDASGGEVRARVEDERLWMDREKEDVELPFVRAEQ